jgi:hypothetical protein
LNPDSEDPIASVITTLGSASRYSCLTEGENSAAWLEIATTEEASWSPAR